MSSSITNSDADEIDFMSDEFLEQCTKNDVRPGLLFKSSEKRRHEQDKRRQDANDSKLAQKNMADTSLLAGLQKQITQENKGYQMLEKMGFKPGGTLGKRVGLTSGALKEPIPIEIKRGRACLGLKTVLKQNIEKKESLGNVEAFRSRLQNTTTQNLIKSDFRKAQGACQSLDLNANIKNPHQPWYWPVIPKSNVEEISESEEEEEEPSFEEIQARFEEVLQYLRTEYYYCVWCGTSYDDVNDLQTSCPGRTRDDH